MPGLVFGAGRDTASVWSPPHGTRAALQAQHGEQRWLHRCTPAGPGGTPPGLGRGWEALGNFGAESLVWPSLVPGWCLAVGQSRGWPEQRFTCSVPRFPHLWKEVMAGENALFLPSY